MKRLRTAELAILLILGAGGSTALAQDNPFDPVWAIMTQDHGEKSNGCRGCHVREAPIEGIRYFGNTEEEVQAFFESGDGSDLVDGGDQSVIASYLRSGFMPFGGMPWDNDQLQILFDWLNSIPH